METVLAIVRLNKQDVTVKVLSVFKTGDGRRVATVEALPVNGREIAPFTSYSAGGPYQSNTARVRVEFLRGLSRVKEPVDLQPPAPKNNPVGITRINGADVEIEITEVYITHHGEKIATVRALPVNGKRITPFLNTSSRGNPYTDTGRIPADEIRGLSLVDLETARGA